MATWSLNEYLLADVVDTLRWLQWAKTEDGSRGRNRPRPVPRPGIEESPATVRTRFGSEPVPIAELDAFLGWNAAQLN